jgi:hypothetical protein
MNFISDSIWYLSIFVWLLPPFRQKKTFFFYYFFVLAIADLMSLILYKFVKISFSDLYIVISFCLFIALQEIEYLKRRKMIFIGIGLIVISLSFFRIGNNTFVLLIMVLHLIIILRILYLFVMVVAEKQSLNFFYLVLAFYEFTVLLKFLNFLFELKVEAQTYFYITTGFELLVGIFFTTFREDSAKLVYKLK